MFLSLTVNKYLFFRNFGNVMYTLFSAVSRLTTETIDSGGTAKLSIANRKTSTNILVLSSSNKTSTVFNMRKMNHILMPRLSKRNSSTFNVNQLKKVPAQPISSKIQKSIAKLSNQRPIIVGGETSPTGTLTNLSAKPQKTFDKIQCNLCDMTFFLQVIFSCTSEKSRHYQHLSTLPSKFCYSNGTFQTFTRALCENFDWRKKKVT